MVGISEKIRERLFELQDLSYRDFQARLIPTIEKEKIIGVRTPELNRLAREIAKDGRREEFLGDLPHRYYEENNIHMFLIGQNKDFYSCLKEIEQFLPYIDNWATCDAKPPKIFARYREELIPFVYRWLDAKEVYTVRFGIGILMRFYLDDAFREEYVQKVAKIRQKEYYINMMIAWYFATALAKQYTTVLPYIEGRCLDAWTHNKAIQKARESRRITAEQKEYVSSLKIKNK